MTSLGRAGGEAGECSPRKPDIRVRRRGPKIAPVLRPCRPSRHNRKERFNLMYQHCCTSTANDTHLLEGICQ